MGAAVTNRQMLLEPGEETMMPKSYTSESSYTEDIVCSPCFLVMNRLLQSQRI